MKFWSVSRIENQLTWKLMKLQVPFSTPHSIQNKLLTFHATVWLHLQYHGHVFRHIVWEITAENGWLAWCGASNSSHFPRIHLPSQDRLCIFGLKSSLLQVVLMVNVACHCLVYDDHLDLWPHLCSWEKCFQESQFTNLGYPKVSCSSKKQS